MTSANDTAARIRVAVIGAGRIAHEHLGFLAGTTRQRPVDGVEVVGLCDLSAATAGFLAERFGVPRTYTHPAEMLANERPDVVHVLSPPRSHADLVAASLTSGAHVICEKPVTPSASELDRLLDQASAVGRVLMESQNYRFNTTVSELDRIVSSGQIGDVTEIDVRVNLATSAPNQPYADPNLTSVWHSMPGGVVHDFLTHLASLVVLFAPDVGFEAIGIEWNVHGPDDRSANDLDALLIGTGPNGPIHARVRFDARGRPELFRVVVRGTKGYGEAAIFHPSLRIVRPRAGGSKLSPLVNELTTGVSAIGWGARQIGARLTGRTTFDGLHRMLASTYRALIDGAPVPVTPAEMRASSRLVDLLVDGRYG